MLGLKRALLSIAVCFGGPAGYVHATIPPLCATPDAIKTLRQSIADGKVAGRNEWRPASVGQIKSAIYPLTVHWQVGVSPVYAQEILSYAELSWYALIEIQRFRPPLPDGGIGGDDNLDLYVITSLPAGVGGYTGFSGFGDDGMQTAFGFVNVSDKLTPTYIRGVVAHELFHTIQLAYHWWEGGALMEASANLVMDQVFPDEKFYWHYYPYFNATPYRSVGAISQQDPYQYGASLWLEYLEEKFGDAAGKFHKQLWEQIAAAGKDFRPYYFAALKQLLGGQDGLFDAYIDFGTWRVLLGSRNDTHHFRRAGDWNSGVDPAFEVNAQAGVTAVTGASSNAVEALGQSFLTFGQNRKQPVHQQLVWQTQQDMPVAIQTILRSDKGNDVRPRVLLSGTSVTTLTTDAAVGAKEVIYVISNLGPKGTDLDLVTAPATDFTYSMQK